MRLHLFLFLFLNCTFSIFGQISKSDQKKLEDIIGENFILIPTQNQYPYSHFENRFKADLSTFLLGDTVGVSFQNEQLLWHDKISFIRDGVDDKKEIVKYFKSNFVTNGEYQTFQNYVRDSIARELIYFDPYERSSCCYECNWTGDDAKEWINYTESYFDEGTLEYKKSNFLDRELMRSIFPLNWDKKLDYNDPIIIGFLSFLYYSDIERIYRHKEFDERKFIYSFEEIYEFDQYRINGIGYSTNPLFKVPYLMVFPEYSSTRFITESVSTISNPYSWALSSNSERDEFSVLAQTYTKLELNSPIIGINNPQAKAYCHWKEELLQKEIDKKNLPYRIVLSIPTVEDLEKMKTSEVLYTIPAKDYTDQWKITNEEYTLFTESVKDSILREFLFFNKKLVDSEANKFIKYTELYFNETYNDHLAFDRFDRDLSRSIFPLNYSAKIKKYPQSAQLSIDSFKLSKEYTNPKFMYYTNESRSFYPELSEQLSRNLAYKYYGSDTTNTHYDKFGCDYGVNSDKVELNFINTLNQSTNVTGHSKYQQFRVYIEISPTQGTDNSNPKALTQGLTYEQALAFYYWKYPIYNPNPKDDWQKFVLPSKEQYEEIQKGKQMNLPEKMVAFPTPVFRYVVHVFPK